MLQDPNKLKNTAYAKLPDPEEQNPNEGQETSEASETYDNGTPKDLSVYASGGGMKETGGITGGTSLPKTTGAPFPTQGGTTGYTNVGHDGTFNGMNREQWRDAFLSQGKFGSTGAMDSYLSGMGAQKQADNGTFLTPFGESLDLGMGYRTGTPTAAWTIPGGGAPQGASGGGASGQIGSGTTRGGGASGFGTGPVADAIQRLLGRGESTDFNDPSLSAARAAHNAASDRALRQSRAALAERMAGQGLNSGGAGSGAFDTALQSQIEAAGIDNAQFDSQLVLDEMQSRRQDVVNALQFAQGEERMALQQYLAEMDRDLQARGLDLSNQHFYDNLGYQIGQNDRQYDLDYMRLLAGM